MFAFLGYFFIFVAPVAGYFAIGQPPILVMGILSLSFFANPICDYLLRRFGPTDNFWYETKVDWPRLYKIPLYLCFPIHAIILFKALTMGTSNWEMALASGILCGISGGILGIAAGHELTHSRRPSERRYGLALLYLINYPHFHLEHRWHHMKVATPADADTAQRNESLYRFLIRSLPQGWRACWRWKKEMRQLTIIQLALMTLAFVAAGPMGFLVFAVQGIVTLLMLKWINYVEHYGLTRRQINGKLEPVCDVHSWDSQAVLTNWSLFNLGFHSQHHANAQCPYYQLPGSKNDWNRLPLGYPSMMVLALVPSRWKNIMNPLLDRIESC